MALEFQVWSLTLVFFNSIENWYQRKRNSEFMNLEKISENWVCCLLFWNVNIINKLIFVKKKTLLVFDIWRTNYLEDWERGDDTFKF